MTFEELQYVLRSYADMFKNSDRYRQAVEEINWSTDSENDKAALSLWQISINTLRRRIRELERSIEDQRTSPLPPGWYPPGPNPTGPRGWA